MHKMTWRSRGEHESGATKLSEFLSVVSHLRFERNKQEARSPSSLQAQLNAIAVLFCTCVYFVRFLHVHARRV